MINVSEGGDRTATAGGADGDRIGVAVGNPDHVEQLVRTALDLAVERGGSVHLLSVVTQHTSSPFRLFEDETIKREFGGDRVEILERAVELAEWSEAGVPVDGTVLVAPTVWRALIRGVVELDCDALVLGWRDRRRQDAILGSNVDRILSRAPCDVLVERIGATADGVESILLPYSDSPHADLAAEVARAIALSNDATVELLHVLPPGDDRSAGETLLARAAESIAPAATSERVAEADDVPEFVVEATAGHDVAVLGATRRGGLRRRLVGSVPQAVGRRADCSVVMTKRPRGLRRRVARLAVEIRR